MVVFSMCRSTKYKAIDAIDNGINQYDTDQPLRYVNNSHLSSRVGKFNLDWTDPDQSSEKENATFQWAMALASTEFLDHVQLSWNAARTNIDLSGEIMVLDRFCPWKLHLYELEQELKAKTTVKYFLYQVSLHDERSKSWRVQAVTKSPDSFESRKALPSQWRGLRDDELSKETGIGAVFSCI